jgi:hypothetical protein
MGAYYDAFEKDITRLTSELKKINAALKKNPGDEKARAARDKMVPFLTKSAIEERQKLAAKPDLAAQGKTIKECGLPW